MIFGIDKISGDIYGFSWAENALIFVPDREKIFNQLDFQMSLQNDLEMTCKWPENDLKMTRKWPENGLKMIWLENDRFMTAWWYQRTT